MHCEIDASGGSLYLASTYNSFDYYQGDLDEAAVYRSALSAGRVQAHYQAGTGQQPPPPPPGPAISLTSPATGSTMNASPTFGGQAGTQTGDSSTVTISCH